ncbi:hypothetical protein DFJ77DRAFT_268160 [Powellomyces hirtus]|nr:hypothetical protein DFJ77DRAFT_268160 [Powellomyces hirtus]
MATRQPSFRRSREPTRPVSLSAPTTPATATARRVPESFNRKEWDATTHDLASLKLSPLQQRQRKENYRKYTQEHRTFAHVHQSQRTDEDRGGHGIELKTLSRSTSSSDECNENRIPAITKCMMKPPSAGQRHVWGAQDEVDFEQELKLWAKAKRAVKPSPRSRKVEHPSLARPPLIASNGRSEGRVEDIDNSGAACSSAELRKVVEGMIHLTNVLSSQLEEPFVIRSLETVENSDEFVCLLMTADASDNGGNLTAHHVQTEISSQTCLHLFRDLTSRAARYISNMKTARIEQEAQASDAQKRIAALEDRVALLEMVSDTTQIETAALQKQLNASTKAHDLDINVLSKQMETLLASEESRAIDSVVKRALTTAAKDHSHQT